MFAMCISLPELCSTGETVRRESDREQRSGSDYRGEQSPVEREYLEREVVGILLHPHA